MIIGVVDGNMKTLCDACETAPAIVFCPADEAALCRSCDDMVHTCNKLASRHLRFGLANSTPPLLCDVCENAAAFFFCEVDGISLCLQCDTIVHAGAKTRTHPRFIILRQRIEFPEEPLGFEFPIPRPVKRSTESQKLQHPPLTLTLGDYRTAQQTRRKPKAESSRKGANKTFDFNSNPSAVGEPTSNSPYKKQR